MKKQRRFPKWPLKKHPILNIGIQELASIVGVILLVVLAIFIFR